MKVLIFLFFFAGIIYPQIYQVKQITGFNFDSRNPSFLQYPFNIPWQSNEPVIFFEAIYNDSSSSICLLKYDESNDSFYQFTEITPPTDSAKINRKAEGRFVENYPGTPYKIVFWETNQNGNWDIAFSIDSGDGWTKPELKFSSFEDERDLSFIIDPFAYNFNIQIQFLFTKGNSVHFYYEEDSVQNEIIFEGNDSVKYSNPVGAYSEYDAALYAAAIREINGRDKKIVYRKRELHSNTWSEINTVFDRVPPEKIKFVNADWLSTYLAFEIQVNRVKRTFLIKPEDFGTSGTAIPLMQNPLVENTNIAAFSFGIITENPEEDFYSFHPFTYRFRRNDSTYIRVGEVSYYYYPFKDYHTRVPDARTNLAPLTHVWEGILSYTIWEDSANGKINLFGIKRVDPLGDVKDENTKEKDFNLLQNFPNPFNPETIIKYEVRKTSPVKITVINLLGEEIKILVNEIKEPGLYEVNFNGADLSSGVYFCRLKAGNFIRTNKMILLR